MKNKKQFITKISYKDMIINVKVTKKALSKKIRLKPELKNNSINISIPYYLPFKRGLDFLNEKVSYIYEILQKNLPIYIVKQKYITLLDKKFAIKLINNNNRSKITLINNTITIQGKINNEKVINNLLKKFIKDLARSYITEFISQVTDTLGITVNKVFLKDNISKWGSCSSLKNISINWRLIFAPKMVLNYIIYHEVAHLIYFNHRKDFWDLVETLYPNYKEALTWLKNFGNTLYRYKF